jgi:putative copper export protein
MLDWDVAAVVVKALLYATCLTAGGGVLFMTIFGAGLTGTERLHIVRFTRAMAVVALAVTVVRVMILSGLLGGNLASLWDWSLIRIVLEGSEGQAAAVRAAGLVGIAAFSFGTGATQAIALLGALLAAGSFALTGHTVSVGPGDVPRLIVALHLLGVSYWIGALVPLFRLTSSPELPRVGAILRRFGNIAAFVVPALIAAGLILLWLLLGTVEAVFASAYGRLVLLKLSFVAGLMTLAAVNKLRLTPGVEAGNQTAIATLRWSIASEMALAAAILILTATFTTVVGPPELE